MHSQITPLTNTLSTAARRDAVLHKSTWKLAEPGRLYIGRVQELAVLLDVYGKAATGQAQIVLIAGDPGIGKTRLVDEATARMAEQGALVLCGNASDHEGMPPYLPFLEALGQYVRESAPDQLRAQIGPTGSILADLFPELLVRLGDLPPRYPLPPDQAQLRLHEAVGDFLSAIAASRPLVLALGDLHQADHVSLELLYHLARRLRTVRLLIVGSYRDSELDENPTLRRVIVELNRARLLTTTTLQPLTHADIAMLASTYMDRPAPNVLSALLHKQSEGNPFFAEEILLGWIESGALDDALSPYELRSRLERSLPPGLIAAVRQRIDRLDPAVRDTLQVAALIGRTIDASLLASVSGKDMQTVEHQLAIASEARLLRKHDDDTYVFGHDKVRECLYAELSASRRQLLHDQIGQALEGRVEQPGEYRLAQLAYHFTRGSDRERGIHHSLRAAAAARGSYVPAAALVHFRAALDLLEPHDRRRGDLLLAFGETALQAGANQEAQQIYAAACDWWRDTGAPLAAARAMHGLGRARWRLGAPLAARKSLEGALELLAGRLVPEVVQIQIDLASLLSASLMPQTESLVHAYRALEAARRLGQPELEVAALRSTGHVLARENMLTAGTALLVEGMMLAGTRNDPALVAGCCADLAEVYAWAADFGAAFEMIRLWEGYAATGGERHRSRYLHSRKAFLLACRGEWSAAEHSLAQSHQTVDDMTDADPFAYLRQVEGFLAWQRGELNLAEQALREALAMWQKRAEREYAECLAQLILVLLSAGKHREAEHYLAEQEALLVTQRSDGLFSLGCLSEGFVLACLTWAAIDKGDRARASTYYPRLLSFQGQHHWFLVDRLLAAIEMQQENWAAAEVHVTRAIVTGRRERLRPELARSLVALADLELARDGIGSEERAHRALGEALSLFHDLGLEGEADAANTRLGAPAPQPLVAAPTASFGKLTERETAVLRLVVEGKSNRQIASELFLSEKTVANHLTSIFTKTNTDNRAGAVGFAFRSGLA